MKKAFSLLLTLCFAVSVSIPAFAADAQPENGLIEEATKFYPMNDDPTVLYIRFGDQVRGVTETFKAEYLPDPLLSDEAPDAIPKDDVSVILPCEENGGGLELFLKTEVYGFDLHITGLLDAQENAFECTVRENQFDQIFFEFWNDDDDGMSFMLNFYTGEYPLAGFLWGEDIPQLTDYCLVGDTIRIPELPSALQGRGKLTCDGVELRANDDGTYTAVSGTGTVTYTVAGQFSTSAKLCIQTPEERRVFASREAAKHPLVTAYFWMSAAFVYPVAFSSIGYVFLPASVLFGLVTLPLGYLVQVIGLRFGI